MARRQKKRWGRGPIAIAAALVALGVVAVVGVGITSHLLRQPSNNSQPSANSEPSTSRTTQPTTRTTTRAPAAPVAEAALPNLLLNPDQLNAAMGTTVVTVTRPTT